MKTQNLSRNQQQVLLAGIAFLYWLGSFFLEGLVFQPGAAQERLFTYVTVKLLSLITIYALLHFFVSVFRGRRERTAAFQTFLYMLPPFLLIGAFWAVCHAWPLSYGDQLNIMNASYHYSNMGGFFHYLTTYVYMVAMNLVPSGAFAVLFKIFLISLGAGYCVYRMRRICPNLLPFLLYVPFLVPPGLYLSYNIHRCPMYAVLYLVVSCQLLCDYVEGEALGKKKLLLLSLALAVLTQWRSEGIYLLVFGPLLLLACYRPQLSRKAKAAGLALMLAAQLLVYFPQSLEDADAASGAGGRTIPLFEYLITGMMRKGLDTEENAADLAVVDRYLSLEGIRELNERNGDGNYVDNLIILSSDARREDATAEDIEGFKAAVIRLAVKNPLVYVKNQLSAWSFISTSQAAERKLDVIANVFTDLYVPTLWLLGLWLWATVKKNWGFWVLTSCHLGHMLITTALLPAAYFKYYYSEYLYAVLTLLLVLQLLCRRRREKKERLG